MEKSTIDSLKVSSIFLTSVLFTYLFSLYAGKLQNI
jgi:hypothetical protein